jgi:hypothetical protein
MRRDESVPLSLTARNGNVSMVRERRAAALGKGRSPSNCGTADTRSGGDRPACRLAARRVRPGSSVRTSPPGSGERTERCVVRLSVLPPQTDLSGVLSMQLQDGRNAPLDLGGSGTGSEVMRRIASPMVGGMITAPLLSMFVVPVAYGPLRRRSAAAESNGPLHVHSGRSRPTLLVVTGNSIVVVGIEIASEPG